MGYIVAEHAMVIVNYQIIDPIPHARRELNKRVKTIIPRLARTLNLFSSFSHVTFNFCMEAYVSPPCGCYLIN
jgi:hypothetical protein